MSFHGQKAEICKNFGNHDGKIGTILRVFNHLLYHRIFLTHEPRGHLLVSDFQEIPEDDVPVRSEYGFGMKLDTE